MKAYSLTIKRERIFQSMSRKGIAMIIRSWRISLGYSSKKSTMVLYIIVLKN